MQGFLRLLEKNNGTKIIKKYYIRLNSSQKKVKIIKCLDKFDNLFSLFKNPKKTKQMYLQEINLFILPL